MTMLRDGARAVAGWLIRTWPGRVVLALIVGACVAWYWRPDPPVPVATTTTATATATAESGTSRGTTVSTAQADLETVGGETVVEFDAAGRPTRIRHAGGTLRMKLKTSATATTEAAFTRSATATVRTDTAVPVTVPPRGARGFGLGLGAIVPVRPGYDLGIGVDLSYGLGGLNIPLIGVMPVRAFAGVDFPFGSYAPSTVRAGFRAGG